MVWFKISNRWIIIISLSESTYQLSEPPITITCTETPCSVGQTMTDTGGHLIVGAPDAGAGGRQRGAVFVINNETEWETM